MKKIFLICFILLINFNVFAQVQENVRQDYFGAGVLIARGPYCDIETKVYPVPLISWEKNNFFIEGIRGGYHLINKDYFELSAVLTPKLMGYDDEDAVILNGMEDRNRSLDAGIQLKYEIKNDLIFNLKILNDVMGKNDGQEIIFDIAKKFKGKIFLLTPSLGIKWQSKNIVDYYYGVTYEEDNENREPYFPGSVLNYFGNISFLIGISKDLILATNFNCEWLSEEITNSPIVDKTASLSAVIGITKRF